MTKNPDLAYRPDQVDQLDGSVRAGLNCNCAACADAIDRSTLGHRQTNAAVVRRLTGDTSGGTTLEQVARVAEEHFGVHLDVEKGLGFASFEARIASGQGAILQGDCSATIGTEWQESETFSGNHSWFVNDVVDGEFLVYFPLGDARRPGITDSPRRVPRAIVRRFAALLDVSDPAEPYRPLGDGKVFAAFTRDTEPHVHLRAGARRTRPFPDRTRAAELRVRVRSEPGRGNPVVDWLEKGDLFVAFQQTDHWVGNHTGTRWVPKRALRYLGGDT